MASGDGAHAALVVSGLDEPADGVVACFVLALGRERIGERGPRGHRGDVNVLVGHDGPAREFAPRILMMLPATRLWSIWVWATPPVMSFRSRPSFIRMRLPLIWKSFMLSQVSRMAWLTSDMMLSAMIMSRVGHVSW